ncbi:peptidylprolyl isomerase [Paenibacillus roseipurpureus]|uniref:Peptidylprolyl isomerase n=1 Tax=Paenibacillus roseopurpureus TaxID=2918901 RepID=A0AA96LKZ0_9BACL|nr:hypothetical protein [Paenibacillus sp. MBLB1832]WNR42884.1 hypothetical protein MJB10_17385 [Paenibacillus sp. MBLB1832]
MKRRNVVFLFFSLVLLVSLSTGFYFGHSDKEAPGTVMTINGSPVSKFDFFLITGRDLGDAPAPITDQERNAVIRTRLTQLEASARGIQMPVDYNTFMQQLKAENERRRIALEKHEPIYGPKQFKERDYFDYLLSNAKRELRDKLQGNPIDVSETKLLSYYESNTEKLARKLDTYVFHEIVIPGTDEDARAEAEAIMGKIKTADKFETAYQKRLLSPGLALEETMNQENRRNFDKYHNNFFALAKDLKEGQLGKEIVADQENFKLILCTKREAGGYFSYEEIKNEVLQRYLDATIADYTEQLVAKAKVRVMD